MSCSSSQSMHLVAYLILQAGCHYSKSLLQSLSSHLQYWAACNQHQFKYSAAASCARKGTAAFLVASNCSGSLPLAGNQNLLGFHWSSSGLVLDGQWSLPFQWWITTSCLAWQDLLSGDPPLLSCFSIQFLNWNSLRPTVLEVKGGYCSGEAAVLLAALPSTWHLCYNSWTHDCFHSQVTSHYNNDKEAK